MIRGSISLQPLTNRCFLELYASYSFILGYRVILGLMLISYDLTEALLVHFLLSGVSCQVVCIIAICIIARYCFACIVHYCVRIRMRLAIYCCIS